MPNTEHVVSDVTRVAAGDDRVRYDPPAMALHWATLLLVVTLWLLAQAWGFLPRGSAPRHVLMALHVSLGLTLILVLATRIGWRLGPSRRLPPADTGWTEVAARGVHYLLYGLLVCMVITGLFNGWLHDDLMTFFWLFTIPAPVAKDKALAGTVNEIHNLLAYAILGLAALHALAALFHHYVLRDDVLLRMLPGRRARRMEAAAPPPPGAPPQR
jgi:cytochrome b561